MNEARIDEVPEHIQESLKTLAELRRRLDVEMHSGLAASKGAGINRDHVRMAMQLANASKQLSSEARAWAKQLKALAGHATLEERLEAVKRFLLELPEDVRAEVLADVG